MIHIKLYRWSLCPICSALTAASTLSRIIYILVGTPYLALYLHAFVQKSDAPGIAVKTGLLVFIPGVMMKCAVLALVVPRLYFVTAPLEKR